MQGSPGRRALLLAGMAGMALTVTGCLPSGAPAEAVRPGPAPSRTAAAARRSFSSDVPRPIPRRPPRAAPDREQIVAGFSGRSPSYWGLEAPQVLTTLPEGSDRIALTLDFCGGPGGDGIDSGLVDMLRRLEVPATLFLNGRWITANPALARDLAADPLFELANHGTHHHPLSVNGASAYGISGTEGPGSVYDEIMVNDGLLAELTGNRPRFFRPGTAYLDDVAAEICLALDLIPAGFSINGDGGATYTAAGVAAETAAAGPGDVIIAHGNHPGSGTGQGLAGAVASLLAQGRTFSTLGDAVPAQPL